MEYVLDIFQMSLETMSWPIDWVELFSGILIMNEQILGSIEKLLALTNFQQGAENYIRIN
jgi:hypothetical protein